MGSYDDGFKYYENKQDARTLSIVGGTYSSYIALAMFICAWDGKDRPVPNFEATYRVLFVLDQLRFCGDVPHTRRLVVGRGHHAQTV